MSDQTVHEITALQVRTLLNKIDPFILDCGSNDGQTTKEFLAAMPNATVIAFEPDPRPVSRFVCSGDPRVSLYQCAISDTSGTSQFYQSGGEVPGSNAVCAKDWDFSGSIQKPTGHLDRDKVVKFPTSITVQTRRLDDFLHLFPPAIDYIHADLQGGEARMILGGQETLRRTHWFYCEFYNVEQYERQPDLKGLLSFLPDWSLKGTFGDNALFHNKRASS